MLAALVLAGTGCTTGSKQTKADLEVTPAQGNMCLKQLGTSYEWQGLQLASVGDAELVITNIEVRGDSSCAFQCFREAAGGEPADQLQPCPQESEGSPGFEMLLEPGAVRFVSIVYSPSEAGVTDYASLVVTSNADSYLAEGSELGQVEIPLCGQGFEQGELPDAGADPDAGVDCPECEPIDPGAPGCADGYPEP
jgi:hypothetical protein